MTPGTPGNTLEASMEMRRVIAGKMGNAIRYPERILPQLFLKIKHCGKVKRISTNGKVFYEYEGERYPEYLATGNASRFILEKAKQYCRGRGIDVGAGKWPLPGATPIQEGKRQDAFKLDASPDGSLDFVFSSHCLEHLDDWQRALRVWIRKLKTHGILFLYLPHESMRLWNPGGPWVGVMHRWTPTCEVINPFLVTHGMSVLEHNPDRDAYWSFHIVARKIT